MRQLCAAGAIVFGTFWGCNSPDAKAPSHPTRPLDEKRALSIIAQAYRDAGAAPAAGRPLRLTTGKSLRVDVGTEGRRFGIAYLTGADQSLLDPQSDLPPHTPGGDLPVVQGVGVDSDSVILVLFADDYQYDDFLGTDRESPGIAAEKKLARDVRDFLAQARLRKLP
ncbi:MAG: hypothetical protein ABW133_19920 [Polyangiaceae bacterium]